MSSVARELAELLKTARRPGDYFATGTIELLAPKIEVEGVGPIALPLLPIQAEQLVAAAERAPFGRGKKTLVDTDVRRTWQIDAGRVRVSGKHWARTLETLLARVMEGLGVADPVTAELYKLLVYDQGSFFVGHRDTEKAPGMFATLVIALPSISTGGELVVRHKGREARLDLRSDDPSEAAFAAFYADCVHEVLPVTSGCRLVLVYNLRRKAKGPALRPPSYEAEQARVGELLRAWAAAPAETDVPRKLIWLLEHAYTPAELAFRTLKGADAAAASVLLAASAQADCELHLALLSIEETGSADYVDTGSHRRRWSEPDLEAGEVDDRWVTLSDWRRPDGAPATLGDLPGDDDELSPPDAFEDVEPDEVEFEEATGNAGATFERTYRRAALVLWPRRKLFAVLNQAGLGATLPLLDDLASRWAASGEGRESPLWQDAHALSRTMTSSWTTEAWDDEDWSDEDLGDEDLDDDGPDDDDLDDDDLDDDDLDDGGRLPSQSRGPSTLARMLGILTRLGDEEQIAALLTRIAGAGHWLRRDSEATVAALRMYKPVQRAALIACIITGTAETSPEACADLLARAVEAEPKQSRGVLLGAATSLADALPGDTARTSKLQPWQRPVAPRSSFTADLLVALADLDETLAQRTADRILERRKTYDLDTHLIPAVLQLWESPARGSGAVRQLRGACLEHLRTRIAEPLAAPTDWARASAVNCKCANCTELSRFLADRQRKSWIFKAPAYERAHVEQTIKVARCDLDTRTERKGSPHGLVCTKTQASYDRRVRQRSQDLATLKRLQT